MKRCEKGEKTLKRQRRDVSDDEEQHVNGTEKPEASVIVPSFSRFGKSKKRKIVKETGRSNPTDCCTCKDCQCACHKSENPDVSEMKSALKRSKELFMEKVFPTEEEKQAIACRGMKLKTINKWFINYRYSFFKKVIQIAKDNITKDSSKREIKSFAKLHYKDCFSCASKTPPKSARKQLRKGFQAWKHGLENAISPEEALKRSVQ